uniref:Xeroderma pigmentosum, complementation group C n=1 Tax=Denticeps clupeoides TaxID=299321 RepID=A0AAY4DUD4_9TELE
IPQKAMSKTARRTSVRTSKYFGKQSRNKEGPEVIGDEGDQDENSNLIIPHIESKIKTEEDEASEEDEDWEEVEELAEPLGPPEMSRPSQLLEIEIETPEMASQRQKREKSQNEFESYLRRMMKRINKDMLEEMHKVHLLCLLAGGMIQNRLFLNPDLLAVALSLVPTRFTTSPPRAMWPFFKMYMIFRFTVTFTLNSALPEEKEVEPRAVLEKRLGSLSIRDHQEMTHLFLLVLRSLRLFCRLVLSLQPVPFKPPTAKTKAKTDQTKNSSAEKTKDEPKVSLGSKRPSGRCSGAKAERGGKRQKKDRALTQGTGQRPKNTKRRSIASKVNYKEVSSGAEGESSEGEEFQINSEAESDDSDFDMGTGKGKMSQASRKPGGVKKQVSSEEEEEEKEEKPLRRVKRKEGKGEDEWLEVYLDGEDKWVCVDVVQGVGQEMLCSSQATQPLSYIIAIDGDGCVKDLSSRYDLTWMTSSRKRRVDQEWWEETLGFYKPLVSERERSEDRELQARLLNKPLPTSIAEYKNHPLYALARHLLKYEALYPHTAAIIGYCKGEAVYSRDCVHTLHSRDTWLKEARTVRLGEEPYKMVRGFSNQSRKARMMSELKDKKDLPLFGEWQTEEYEPPIALDGKVPRNDFGNVYMFKPCMLPVGCVHLHLPNLHRVARKLNMDCAPAVTGFDFHGGYSHAVTDGYIVCEDHKEILTAAWENEQELLKIKEREKREKRVLSNWTLLVKGLLIRERLKRRYGQQGLTQQPRVGQGKEVGPDGLSSGEEEEGGTSMDTTTLVTSWPQNRQEEQDDATKKATTKRERRGQEKHMFPFEKV